MCLFVIIVAPVPYSVIIYFCKLLLRDISGFVSQKKLWNLYSAFDL